MPAELLEYWPFLTATIVTPVTQWAKSALKNFIGDKPAVNLLVQFIIVGLVVAGACWMFDVPLTKQILVNASFGAMVSHVGLKQVVKKYRGKHSG